MASDWHLWNSLRKLRQTKKRAPTPSGYDELAQAVIDAADGLTSHPGPLSDAIDHAKILISSAVEAIKGYAEDKRASALVDYTDMVAAAQLILADNAGALNSLAERVDCLVIDEFQDTNPLQFSLLWLLHKAGIPTLIVGDLKQAIMGFQGADPRLMEKLLDHEGANTDTLDRNWRTQPSLMPFINGIGTALFNDKYASLEAQSKEGFQPPLEVLEQPKPLRGGASKATQALRVAERIRSLLDDSTQHVRDRHTGEKRRLGASDIAILCPNNTQLRRYADALRDFGIKAKISEDGWLTSRIVQIACYALEYADNPADRHAALYLSSTELGSHTLQSAVSELVEKDVINDPVLSCLDGLQGQIENLTIDLVVSKVINALDLYGQISTWPDSRSYRADLLRLEAEATAFIDAKPETLASGGFFGSGVKTFLSWLSNKVEQDKEANNRPDPDASSSDAVEMVTWHRSKGREWPVVFVCGWEADVKPRLPELSVQYEKFDDLDHVLEDARISFIPGFAAGETNDRFLDDMRDDVTLSAKRLIYVAVTRARERLVLEWHSHLSNSSKNTYHTVLTNEANITLGDSSVDIGTTSFPCIMSGNDGTPPDVPKNAADAESLVTYGRRAISAQSPVSPRPQIFTTPSSLEDCTEAAPATEQASYGSPFDLSLDLSGTDFGSLVHRHFEVLTKSPASISRLNETSNVILDEDQSQKIAASHAALTQWLKDKLGATDISAEVPFSAVDEDGVVCTGIIDLLVETSHGYWVFDHKTDKALSGREAFELYWPQLRAYKTSLECLNYKVVGIGLNLINEGNVLFTRNENG